MFLGEFATLFQCQIYFLQVMQYTNLKRQKQEGKKLITTTSILIFIYLVAFSFIGVYGYTSNATTKNSITLLQFVQEVLFDSTLGQIFFFQCQLIQFLAFPFKFFIGKESLNMLIDELKRRSLSKKIDELKTYTS